MGQLFASRKDEILDIVKKQGCLNYVGCSICFKCIRKAAHLHEACNKCPVPVCLHKQTDRELLIKAKNFTTGDPELLEILNKEYDNYVDNKEKI